MKYTVSATTTDRDAERFHVDAPDPETGLRRAESHLRRSRGWTRDDVARSVIHVVPAATMTTYDQALENAARIGREHGENAAATWLYLQDGPFHAYLSTADPADVLGRDDLPAPDLSGEWADGYLPADLTRDCGLVWDESHPSDESYWQSDLCDAYETAFSAAVEEAVTAACRQALA